MTKEHLLKFYNEEDLFFIDGFDKAIIGVSTNMNVIYSTSTAIEILVQERGFDLDDAIQFAEYNLFFGFYENSPIWVYDTFDLIDEYNA